MSDHKIRKGVKALLYCHSMPDPDLSSRIIILLLEKGRMSVKDISNELEVSYPLVLRLVNDMTSIGILDTDREKPEGRGRARKVVSVNKEGLLDLIEDCLETLTQLKEELTS